MTTTSASWTGDADDSGRIEWASASFRGVAFSPHRHDTYAIGVTTAGVQTFDYRGAQHNACPGDAFILHPDELHDGRQGTDAGYAYRILYIDPALIVSALDGRSLPFVSEPTRHEPRLLAAIHAVLQLEHLHSSRADSLTVADAPTSIDTLAWTDALTELADTLQSLGDDVDARRRAHRASGSRTDVALMQRVREELRECAPQRQSMTTLERQHGIDRFTLARRFRAIFGISPRRFVTMRRLEIAREAIRRGESLAVAANLAGFADQSHMTRQFRAAYGVSPGAWQRLVPQGRLP